MKKIINEAWNLEELDSTRLAKYMRCLFQIALADNTDVAEQLLDQVQDHTEQAAEVCNLTTYMFKANRFLPS